MIAATLRLFLLLGVILGITLPKSTAALAELGLIDARVIVICTGTTLETLVLDAEGNPVRVDHAAHPCLLAHAADTATPASPRALPASGGRALAWPRRDASARPAPRPHDAPPRAPPSLRA